MKNKTSKKPLALNITTSYWATKKGPADLYGNRKEILQYEAKAKDVFGNKYTFTVDSKEPPPTPTNGSKYIVSPAEWNRIKLEMKHKFDTQYNKIMEAVNKAYLAKHKKAG